MRRWGADPGLLSCSGRQLLTLNTNQPGQVHPQVSLVAMTRTYHAASDHLGPGALVPNRMDNPSNELVAEYKVY